MEVDLRSSDAAALKMLDTRLHDAVRRALANEKQRWRQNGQLRVNVEMIGDRPGGATPAESSIVRTALAVSAALDIRSALDESSTDSNVPISLGIPAITTGAGGTITGAHSLQEVFDTTDSWRGSQRILLLAVALAH